MMQQHGQHGPVFRGKFCHIPWASLQNSAAYRGKIVQIPRPSVCDSTELYSVHKLPLLKAVVVLSYASNIKRKLSIFLNCSLVKLHCVCFM